MSPEGHIEPILKGEDVLEIKFTFTSRDMSCVEECEYSALWEYTKGQFSIVNDSRQYHAIKNNVVLQESSDHNAINPVTLTSTHKTPLLLSKIKKEVTVCNPKILLMLNQNLPGILLWYFFAILTSIFIIAPIYYVVFWLSEFEKKCRDKEYKALLPTRCATPPIFLGILEQLLYITMIITGYSGFIAVWLAYKVLGIWRRWEGETDRISYNMFTIGTALSILNALFWSLAISAKFLAF